MADHDPSSCAAAATNEEPQVTSAGTATTSAQQKIIQLQRNTSLTSSTRSTPSKSSSSIGTHNGRRVHLLTSSYPQSPALSTLSKNSSGSSSLASSAHIHAAAYGHKNVQPNSNSNRMSVDDILNSTKFKGGRRPNKKNCNRSSISSIKRKRLGDNNDANNTGPVKAVITKNKVTSYKNNDNGGTHANSSPNSKQQAVVDVNGREERRERLERLQQEQLQQKRVQGKGGARRRETSLDRVKHLDEEEKGGLLSQDMLSGELLDDDAMSKSSRGSSKSSGSSKKDKLREEVLSGKKSLSTMMGDSSSSRRSKRAKTVAKNDIISTEITMSVKNVPSQTGKGDGEASRDNFTPEEEVEEEPDSAQSALHSLLVKYTCIENSIGVAAINPNPSSSSSLPSWDVVQLLVSVLRYINLLDPTTVNSQECKEVEASLAGVLKSVDRMKWEVMNRNSIIQGSAEDDDVLVTKNDARLLTMIQLQVWMRMMVWSLEDCTGWAFLERVIALADAKNDNKDSGKKLKSDKKKKKSKKKGNKASSNKKSSQTLSPRDSLVQDVRLLMELAPYVLPPSLDFSQWLKDTLTYGFRQSIPEYGTELFDHFEIEVAEPIALKRSGTDTSQMSERSQVSHSPVKVTVVRRGNSSSNISGDSSASPTKQIIENRHKRQQAYFASLAEEERASADDETATITGSLSTVTSTSKSAGSVREKDDTILLKTSVSLTSAAPSQTSNPFLKGSARGSYVGSHLSSKLSNITSLFREVKAAPKPKKAPPAKVISKAVEPKKKNNPSLPWKVNNVTSTKAPPPASVTTESASVASKRKFTAMSSASRMTRLLSASPPKETPYKRPRPGASFRHVAFAVGETPSRQIVEETPIMKNQPVSARQRLRFRDDNPYVGNSIVAETPLGNNNGVAETPQQKSILRGGRGGPAPTNLWNMQHSARRSGKSKMDTRRQHHHQFGRNGNFSTGQEHLSPVVNPFTTRTSGALNYGLSPMPHQEDMASVLAKAAKSAASRKRK